MLSFSWNGTLSRTAVGATLLLLLLALPESHFWLNFALGFVTESAIIGQAFLVGVFVFFAYALGSMISAPHRNRPDWEKTIAEVICLESKEATAIVLDCRSQWELMVGLSRSFYCFAASSTYFLIMQFGFFAFRVDLPVTPWRVLVACMIAGILIGKLLDRVSMHPVTEARKLVGYLEAANRKQLP